MVRTTQHYQRYICIMFCYNTFRSASYGHHQSSLILFIEGPRSRCYGRTAAYCVTFWWRWREIWSVFFIFPSNIAPVEWNWQGKTEVLGGNLSHCLLSTTNSTWTGPGSNPGLRGERPATNRLSHGTAYQSVLRTHKKEVRTRRPKHVVAKYNE
jgi:hypothetical protein